MIQETYANILIRGLSDPKHQRNNLCVNSASTFLAEGTASRRDERK